MIKKIQANQIRELSEALSSRQPGAGSNIVDNDTDVSIQVDYAPLINKAMQASQADEDVVDAARRLLRSGELEKPEKIQEAAENIVAFGV